MTDFPSYTRDELDQRARDHIRMRKRDADVSDGSDYDITSRLLGALAFAMQKHAEVALRLLDERKAFGVFLREFAGIRGIGETIVETSYAARAATGKVIIRSSTGSQSQLAGSVLTHADGSAFTLDSNATTSATATKTLRVGHRSSRRRFHQGHAGAGFVTVLSDEVYQFAPTGEYCAIYGRGQSPAETAQHLFELYNEIDQDPEILDQFTQVFGAVGSITASTAGKAGNKDEKDTLTISSPAGTINASAQILYLTGGRDALTPAQMQQGIRDLIGSRMGTMTLEEVRQVCLDAPTRNPVREAYIFPGAFYGPGTHALIAVGAAGQFLVSRDITAVSTYVQSQLSPADKIQVSTALDVVDNLQAIELRVAPIFAPDWTLSAGVAALTVVTDAGSTNTRTYYSGSAPDFEVGDRVIVSMNTAGVAPYIVQRKITALGAGYIDLDEALPYPAISGGYISPGGPLAQAVIDALYEFYDAQSPALDDGTNEYFRYPSPAITQDITGIVRTVSAVEGVLDATIKHSGAPTLAIGNVLVPGAVQIKMWA